MVNESEGDAHHLLGCPREHTVPGPDTIGVGGNTSCVEVRAGNAFLVFDGGTGLRLLGKRALKEMPFTAHIFFSHVHWDHIQDFPSTPRSWRGT